MLSLSVRLGKPRPACRAPDVAEVFVTVKKITQHGFLRLPIRGKVCR